MKSFRQKYALLPIYNKHAPITKGNHIFTVYNDTLYKTEISSGMIVSKITSTINAFDVNDYVVIANTKVEVYDLELKLVEVLCHEKTDITQIKIINSYEEDKLADPIAKLCFFIGRSDGSVVHYSGSLQLVHKLASTITCIAATGNSICCADINTLWVCKNTTLLRSACVPSHRKKILDGGINDTELYDIFGINKIVVRDSIYYSTNDGILGMLNGVQIDNVCGFEVFKDNVVVGMGSEVHLYDLNLSLLGKKPMDIPLWHVSLDSHGKYVTDGSAMNRNEEDSTDNKTPPDEEVFDYNSQTHKEKPVKRNKTMPRPFLEQETNYIVESIRIERVENNVITTTENEIFLLSPDFSITSIIVGDNEEITDTACYTVLGDGGESRDYLFLATNSGRLRYTILENKQGDYAFKGYLVNGHNEAIMAIDTYKNYLLTVSRDKRSILWEIHTASSQQSLTPLALVPILKTNGLDSLNGCAIKSNIFAIVGKDKLLQVWNYKENMLTKSIHDKEINSVDIGHNLILTASQDKTAKLLTYSGHLVATLHHAKGVWNAKFGQNMILTCSADKTAKLWDMNGECLGTLLHNAAVVSGMFYDNLVVTGSTDGMVKLWDTKKMKCMQTMDYHSNSVWSTMKINCWLITTGGGAIRILDDISDEVAQEKLEKENEDIELRLLAERAVKENEHFAAIEALVKLNDLKGIVKVLGLHYRFDGLEAKETKNNVNGQMELGNAKSTARVINNEIEEPSNAEDGMENRASYEPLKHISVVQSLKVGYAYEHSLIKHTVDRLGKKKLLDLVSRYCSFRHAALTHTLIDEAINRKWILNDKMAELAKKHSSAIDSLYVSLLGCTIFNKY